MTLYSHNYFILHFYCTSYLSSSTSLKMINKFKKKFLLAKNLMTLAFRMQRFLIVKVKFCYSFLVKLCYCIEILGNYLFQIYVLLLCHSNEK